jgi:hypothetical protein
MMERIEARGRRLAARAQARTAAAVAARVEAAVPGVAVSVEDGAVVLTGRRLARRMLTDAALRWIGSHMR